MQSHVRRICARALACSAALFFFAVDARAASLDVNPDFPAYGQPVSVMLNGIDPPPVFTVTRYRRSGNAIVVDLEHNAGGYFGWRSDIGDDPLPMGELPPGQYSVQARLHDIGHDSTPAILFTRTFAVAPPDANGVYAVPRSPSAYSPMQVLVRADAPIDASSLRVTIDGFSIAVAFDFSRDASAPAFATVPVAGLAPGTYGVEAVGTFPWPSPGPRRFSGKVSVDPATEVVEYYSEKLDHYFITASSDEIAALDADPSGAFKRTGQTFKAWKRAADATSRAAPVCRFYASGPNSHFYTADASECEYLKSLEKQQKADASTKGQSFLGWQYEGIAFFASPADAGQCPAATTAIFRAYNDRAREGDSNHRFTATRRMRDAMKMGWADEGVAFCSPA